MQHPFDAPHGRVDKSPWVFPPIDTWPEDEELLFAGADLNPETLVDAYAHGLFPMDVPGVFPRKIGWWSPQYRGILPLDGMKVSRSLRKSIHRFETRVDSCFELVMKSCAAAHRDGVWITKDFIKAYTRLHQLGYAHSIETFKDGKLVGGLYGVRINGFFAGESMFHSVTDASKVALFRLVQEMNRSGMSLLDVQWQTPHLESLGVIEVTRLEYMVLLGKALEQPNLGWPNE